MDDNSASWMDIREVAALLPVQAQTVWKWIKSGKLTATRMGRRWYVKPSDLEAFFKSGMNCNRLQSNVGEG